MVASHYLQPGLCRLGVSSTGPPTILNGWVVDQPFPLAGGGIYYGARTQ